MKRHVQARAGASFKRADRVSDAAGFTIVEVLMGMLLMTIVMLGTMAMQITNIQQSGDLRSSSAAARLAQATIQRLQSVSTANVAPTGGVWVGTLAADGANLLQNVDAQGSGPGPFTVEQLVEPIGAGLIVSVRVSWWPPHAAPTAVRPRSLTLSTRRY